MLRSRYALPLSLRSAEYDNLLPGCGAKGLQDLVPNSKNTTRFQKCFSDFSAHFFVAPLQPLPSTAYKAARCSFPPPRACRCRRRKHFRVRHSVLDTKILANEQIQSFIYLHILLVRCSIYYIICIYCEFWNADFHDSHQ